MAKQSLDFCVTDNIRLHDQYVLLKFTPLSAALPPVLPGQFVEVKVEHSPETFLRRPLSVHFVDEAAGELWLLVQLVGAGTRALARLQPGDRVNMILPLGNSYTLPTRDAGTKPLLIGGGVGTAPLLLLGDALRKRGVVPAFLLGARSAKDLLQRDAFRAMGPVFVTTEDGSEGEKGYVTQHTLLQNDRFDFIYTCGPKPMMVAVAAYAKARGIACEVSLENSMACGIGACLCCVEKTVEGHRCVCTDGPVFNINELTWPI